MDSKNFSQLYKIQDSNEKMTPFEGDIGFSLIKFYPKQTQYHNDGRRLFIKIGLSKKGLIYSVNMTNLESRDNQDDYILTDGEEYKKKVTNYYSGGDEFSFDEIKQKVVHIKTKKEFTMNEFIQILVNNHLSDRLFWKRKLNWCVNYILKFLFWLVDKYYEHVKVSIDKYHFSKGDKTETEEEKNNIEPFFKYFYISKNLMFLLLLIAFFSAIFTAFFPELVPIRKWWHFLFGDFSLSNPMAVLLFFLILFTSEKFSIWLNKSIREFLMPPKDYFKDPAPNFIEKLHNFQQSNKFNLKLNLRNIN